MRANRSVAPVLVGVDGSAGSLAAVELAAWEAKRRRQPLQLVNGYEDETPGPRYGAGLAGPLTHPGRHDALSMLTDVELATRARHPGVRVHSTAVAGGAASALVALSQDASLVVVGARGQGGFGGLLLGSVAAQVSMHAHAPVIVVRPAGADRFPAAGPVVVGVDGSAGSALAIPFAFEEAAGRQAPLVAVHGWFTDQASDGPAIDASIADAVAPWVEKFPDVVVRRRPVRHANPTWSLLEQSRDASLLVVGARGGGGFAGLLLGSVSRTVLAYGRCVAVVRDRS